MGDSDTSIQGIEDELRFEPHVRQAKVLRLSEPPGSISQKPSNSKISLQGVKWSPVAGSHRNGNGIPTIAVKLQKTASQLVSTISGRTVRLQSAIPSNFCSSASNTAPSKPSPSPTINSSTVKSNETVGKIVKVLRPQVGVVGYTQVSPIIVFPDSQTTFAGTVIKGEAIESSNSVISPGIKPSPPQSNVAEKSKIEKCISSDYSTRLVNNVIDRYVGKPKTENSLKESKAVDYTVCSSCKKIVESSRLAIHIAMDHTSPKNSNEQSDHLNLKDEATSSAEHDYGSTSAKPTSNSCPLCKRNIAKDRIASHMQLVHGQQIESSELSTEELAKKPFQCVNCHARFPLRRNLWRHQQFCGSTDPDAKSHMCEICGACFYNVRFMQAHITRAHTSHFTCEECGASFRLKRFLQQHKVTKHRKRRRRRSDDVLTQGSFSEILTESNHSSSTADDSQSVSSLKTNSNVDNSPAKTENTSLVAPSRETPQSRRRGRKSLIEGSGPPFACSHCGKLCKHASELRDHEDMHVGIRRHKCDLCEKTYTFKSALVAHKKTHESESVSHQYGCEICFEMFKTRATLNRHKLLKHPGESEVGTLYEDHVCEICDKGLKNEQALRMHILRAHPDNKSLLSSVKFPILSTKTMEETPVTKVSSDIDEDDVALEIDQDQELNSDDESNEMINSDSFDVVPGSNVCTELCNATSEPS